METPLHSLEDVDIIRDPFSEPPKMINLDGVCLSITMLQLLMASPSLMFTLYHHNYCSSLTCFQLRLNIPNNINEEMRWEKNIEYAYLVHEVLVMMGLRSKDKVQKGFTCDNNVTSAGYQKGTHFLWNFYRLVMMRSNCFVNRMESKQSPTCSLMPSKIISVRNKFLEHPELKHNDLNLVDDNSKGLLSKIVDWTSQTVEYGISGMNNTVESYRRSNHLLTTYMSTLTNFLHFLFYGGGGVNKDECVIHIFHGGKLDEVATEIKYNSLFPRKIMLDEDSVSYFPHLSIIYIEIFFSIFEVLKNKENVTLQNFESHLHIPWSDNTFLTEDLWLPKKTAYLVIRYGLPSTVFVSFQDRGYNYMNQPELVTIIGRPVIFLVKMLKENLRMSNEVIGHTKKSFDETNVLEVLKLMENEIKMRFARIKIKLPPEFWCGDIPCRKRLFSNCPMYKYDTEEYTLFGIAFRKSSSVYEIKTKLDEIMIENLEYSTAKEETFNMAFSYVMNQLQGYNVTDRIEKYIRNFAEEMATIKTVMNFKYINRLTARHKNISFPKIDIVSKPGMHSVALVRTFSLKWWYINNNDITPVKNVKEFILNLQISLIPELTAWQRIYNDANLLKNLREIIQPIKLPTTNQKI